MALEGKLREVFLNGMHNALCTPNRAVKEGKDKGRLEWFPELRPVRGDRSGEYPCLCCDVVLRYNDEEVKP